MARGETAARTVGASSSEPWEPTQRLTGAERALMVQIDRPWPTGRRGPVAGGLGREAAFVWSGQEAVLA